MKFRAIIFDLDGTLLDTIEDITDSANAALASLGLAGHSPAIYKKIVGEGAERFVDLALPKERRDADTLKQLALRMRSEYSKRLAVKTKPYEGITELLGELARLNIRMAVLSNKEHEFTLSNVAAFFGGKKFDFIQGAMEGAPKKPDPSSALKIAERLRLLPSEFIFLGDSWVDMKTAVAAGMYPVGALWGFRDKEELESSGAKALIASPRELLGLL